MAKVAWSAGIDHVSGALAKPGSNPQHNCERMLLATHRTAPTTNPDCNRLYMQKKMKRTTPLTPDEIAVRNRFAGIAALVKARKANIQYITTDQENFIAQKNQPGGCKTMKKYYWRICGQEWDAQH